MTKTAYLRHFGSRLLGFAEAGSDDKISAQSSLTPTQSSVHRTKDTGYPRSMSQLPSLQQYPVAMQYLRKGLRSWHEAVVPGFSRFLWTQPPVTSMRRAVLSPRPAHYWPPLTTLTNPPAIFSRRASTVSRASYFTVIAKVRTSLPGLSTSPRPSPETLDTPWDTYAAVPQVSTLIPSYTALRTVGYDAPFEVYFVASNPPNNDRRALERTLGSSYKDRFIHVVRTYTRRYEDYYLAACRRAYIRRASGLNVPSAVDFPGGDYPTWKAWTDATRGNGPSGSRNVDEEHMKKYPRAGKLSQTSLESAPVTHIFIEIGAYIPSYHL